MTTAAVVDEANRVFTDKKGRRFIRVELNGHWVEYRYLDARDQVTHAIAFPRVPLITDEILQESSADE
ncbi:MAG: hypothetical protein EOL91_02600 [Actinobacteria bacterium]|nr:hypothetical protein [Actinomycetota bacterium]